MQAAKLIRTFYVSTVQLCSYDMHFQNFQVNQIYKNDKILIKKDQA